MWRNVLGDEREVSGCLVDDVWSRIPRFGNEITLARPSALRGHGGQSSAAGKGSIRINQYVVIADPPTLDIVLVVDLEVEADEVFTEVERIGGADEEIVGR